MKEQSTIHQAANKTGGAQSNHLFPIFVKLEGLSLLIVGGGYIGLEKLAAVLQNAPATSVRLVGIAISDEIKSLAAKHGNLVLFEKAFDASDADGIDLAIVGINDPAASEAIATEIKSRGILVNVADKPELCDFYLSSVVKKGSLKVAISTNGKSPTIAKRLKETLDEVLPAELDQVLDQMQAIRSKLKGDFTQKVIRLNEITSVLASGKEDGAAQSEKWWKKLASYSLFAFLFMIIGHFLLSYMPLREWGEAIGEIKIDKQFYFLIVTGFVAQLIDGALGMGYGVTCTTVLLSMGVNLPAISGSIHTAEMFSSGVSGYSHYKFGNVNKKLFRALLIPGIIGAVAGAYLLSVYGDEYAAYIRPLLATYTLILGIRILLTAFKKKRKPQKVKRVGWLAGAGGFLDSFGGGGWGPLVTSTLISKGRTPRFVIGSVSITEFFVTLASALTFFGMIGLSHWQVILGLIIGGMLGAPLAAKLSGKLPIKTMFIAVGAMVIIWSLRILIKAFL